MYDDTITVDKAYYNRLREQTTWISVKDRLPEDGQKVLAYYNNVCRVLDKRIDNFETEILRYFSHEDKWIDKLYDDYVNVTHWRPLPGPPESEG